MSGRSRSTVGLMVVLALATVGWVALGTSMARQGRFAAEPNPFCLKGSPFGRTIAYAMRGPADLYWHRGSVEDHSDLGEYDGTLRDAAVPGVNDPGEAVANQFKELRRKHEEGRGDGRGGGIAAGAGGAGEPVGPRIVARQDPVDA